MKLTASKTAITVITGYCNKNSIDFEKLNNRTIYFKGMTDNLSQWHIQHGNVTPLKVDELQS